jgi:transposase
VLTLRRAAYPTYHFKRIGLEAGPLSQWLPVVCVETRHMQAVLKAQINKTDRNDARGIAQMMRVGLYRPVHVKTLRSQKLRIWVDGTEFRWEQGTVAA